VSEQFTQVGESLLKLHPENKELARGLLKAVDSTVRSGEPPTTPVAMEVATSILYLDAAYEDMDPTETANMRERSDRLARRLDHVVSGGQPGAAWNPGWRSCTAAVSDRQTMGSVVGELHTAMAELEGALDQFFRQPREKGVLSRVPAQLAQMRGVLSVLGLDRASLAVAHMRDTVEDMLVTEIDPERATATFDKLGNNLGALGFLIDKTNTRWGRFRPWLVAGLPMAVLAIWMLFMAGRSITGAYILFWLVIGFTGQSMASMAHIAWAARIAPEYGQRSRVYGWWQAFNVVISNVPGPKEPLYWNGARLQGMYPVSIVLDRIALNITVTSYGDSLEFGLIACRRTLPSMQRLLDYLENSMRELEVAAGVCGYNSNRVLTLKSLHPQAFFHSCLPQPP